MMDGQQQAQNKDLGWSLGDLKEKLRAHLETNECLYRVLIRANHLGGKN